MVNTLILPELRAMLEEQDDQGLAEVTAELHPATVADFTEGLGAAETWRVLSHAPLPRQAEIFPYYSPEKQVELVMEGGREHMSKLIEEMASDNRVDLLEHLDPEIVEELLPLVAKAERHEIRMMLSYPEHSAGSVMTTEYASLPEDITAGEAMSRLRVQAPHSETIYYVYILDAERHLLGFVSLLDLILAKPSTPISSLMERDLIRVRVDDDREVVAQQLAKYDFLAIPVVDEHNRLVGIVTHDDVIDVVIEEATEDAHRIGGLDPLTLGYLQTRLFTMTWKRGLWLTILFFTAILTTFALSRYDEQMDSQFKWLILFIPLVISTGGNSGNQSATLVITALSTGDITLTDWARVVRREIIVGLGLGAGLAVLGYFVALIHAPTYYDAIVVPATVLLVVSGGALVGSILPLIFRRLGLDPALMSNPFVAGIADIMGIVIYMNVAMLLLR
jgi:magnesium transporter